MKKKKLRRESHKLKFSFGLLSLEKLKNNRTSIIAYTLGILGYALLGGATFSYLAGMLSLMVIFAVPGFIGWLLPWQAYKK